MTRDTQPTTDPAGTRLLRAALAAAARNGVKKFTIIADPHSTGVYERFGAFHTGNHQSSIAGRVIPVYAFAVSASP